MCLQVPIISRIACSGIFKTGIHGKGRNIYDFPVISGPVSRKEDLIQELREELEDYWAVKRPRACIALPLPNTRFIRLY